MKLIYLSFGLRWKIALRLFFTGWIEIEDSKKEINIFEGVKE